MPTSTPPFDPTGRPTPAPPQPVTAVEPRERYALSQPTKTNDWWEITDTETGERIMRVQSRVPHAEQLTRAAFNLLGIK